MSSPRTVGRTHTERRHRKENTTNPQLPRPSEDAKTQRGDGRGSHTAPHAQHPGDSDTQIKLLQDEVKKLRNDFNQLQSTSHHTCRYQDELDEALKHIRHLEKENARLQETISDLDDEASVLRQQLADAQNKLQLQLERQPSLTKADTLSQAEVEEKLEDLNEDIFQASAFLGEALIPQDYPEDQKTAAASSVSGFLSPNTVSMLEAESRKGLSDVHPLLVQVVLQAFLVNFCVGLIEEWCPGDSKTSRTLRAIYQGIRDTEKQAVSGSWPALTRSRTSPSQDSWQSNLVASLEKLLVFCGWKIASDVNRSDFLGKADLIFKAAQAVRKALGESVVSMDLHAYIVQGSDNWRFHPAYMEDTYGDANSQPFKVAHANVLVGTVGFGLKRMMREKSPDGQLQSANVVSVKVALEATLCEAIEESAGRGNSGTARVPKTNSHPGIPPHKRQPQPPQCGPGA